MKQFNDISKYFLVVGILFLASANALGRTNRYVSTTGVNSGNGNSGSPWRTIGFAVANSTSGDTINVLSGIYNETVTVNKSLTIQSADSSSVVVPFSGNGFNISSNGVKLQNIQVRGAHGIGISANNVSNLTLTNIYSLRDSVAGVWISNFNGLTVTGGSYSYNGKHGIFTAYGTNCSISNVNADSNGWTLNGSGVSLIGVTTPNQVSNPTIRYNRLHGLVIGDGSTGITVNGGIYRKNGLDLGYNGGGIFMYADVASDSNIAIQGSILADSNATAGVFVNAQSSSYVIKNILIGQSGTATFVNNGGAGVIVFGNGKSVTISGTFTHGSASNAAGVVIVGNSTLPDFAPTNVAVNNSTFGTGYSPSQPVITLDDNAFHISNQPVTATGNTYTGASSQLEIEALIHDSLDDAHLGRVNHSNDNPLPVELVSFYTQVKDKNVTLAWSTATEVNSYGFEVEKAVVSADWVVVSHKQSANVDTRSAIDNRNSQITQWNSVGFILAAGTSSSPRSYSFTDASVPDGEYSYRLKKIDKDGSFSFSNQSNVVVGSPVTSPWLSQNFPNPFNPTTSIEFAMPRSEKIGVSVYNILGQRIAVLFDDVANAGTRYRLQFDATGIPSGLYFYRLESGSTALTKRMLLLK
jgi:hypothetical protein